MVQEQLICKNGIITESKHRCILKIDDNGEVEGCRDMSHLEECTEFKCPESYVKCPDSFCIPRYMYCDGVKHCPREADEINCDNASCASLFSCRDSSVCIPVSEICDGIRQCKHGDDERLCNIDCPAECTCEGLIFTCLIVPNLSLLANSVRKLTINNTDISENRIEISHLVHIGYLSIVHTNLSVIRNGTFRSSKNMFGLDLSDNQIEYIGLQTFHGLDNLLYLNLSGNKITEVLGETFTNVPKIRSLNMRGNAIESFYDSMFDGMPNLQYLYTDEFRFCCIRPKSVPKENCYPSEDEFSSCEDLMRDYSMRICLWTIGGIALIGNGMSIVYRVIFDHDSLRKAQGIFVLNICVSDFLMGIYLYIIAITDEYYRGKYIYNEFFWRHSVGCKVAGVTATLSSETSTTVLCFITLDRVLAIRYPFSALRINASRAKVFVLASWTISLFIAVIPLLGVPYFEDGFYSRSGTCLALPLTRDQPPGWQYSVAVFLCYNLFAFVVIVIGQGLIYTTIRSSSATSIRKSGGQGRNIAIARNLFLIVFTDFLCWFPIAVMGLAALVGHAVPGEMYAWTTIFILPVNSALNPLLYTLNAYRQKRRTTRHRLQITELTSEIEKLRRSVTSVAKDCDKAASSVQDQSIKRHLDTEQLHGHVKEVKGICGLQSGTRRA